MHPQNYRKTMHLAQQTAKFGFPIITLIDTPKAYPSSSAESQRIASAMATAIIRWFEIQVPVVTAVIGEGGSGGALETAVADRVIMLENSTYSMASPEATASIVWHDNARKMKTAKQLQLTSH